MAFDFSFVSGYDSATGGFGANSAGGQIGRTHYVKALADGSFVVAWTEGDASKTGVYFQRFDWDGETPLNSNNIRSLSHDISVNGVSGYSSNMVRANTYTLNEQEMPRLVALPDGGFGMAWESWGQDGSFDGIFFNRFNWDGSFFLGDGTDKRIADTGLGNQSAPVFAPLYPSLDEEGFAGAWTVGGAKSLVDGVIKGTAWERESGTIEGFEEPGDPDAVLWDFHGTAGNPNDSDSSTTVPYVYSAVFGAGAPDQGFDAMSLVMSVMVTHHDPATGAKIAAPEALIRFFHGDSETNPVPVSDAISLKQDAASLFTSSPRITAIDSDEVFITWQEESASDIKIYGQHWSLMPGGGEALGAAKVLTTMARSETTYTHHIANVGDGVLFMAWDDTGSANIKGVFLGAEGAEVGNKITNDFVVLSSSAELEAPRLAVSDNGVEVVAVRPGGVTGTLVTIEDLIVNMPEFQMLASIYTAIGNAAANIRGTSGGDTITTGTGNDVIDGGIGADTMNGGGGDDIYFVDNADDKILDSEGYEIVKVAADLYTLAEGLEELIYTGGGDFSGTGNDADNIMKGGGGNDTLDGDDGYNLIDGGEGVDTAVYNGSADDIALMIIKLGSSGFTLNGQTTGSIIAMASSNGRVDRMLNVEQISTADNGSEAIGSARNARTVNGDRYIPDDNSVDDATTVTRGGGRNDVLDLLEGDDTAAGGAGNDVLLGRAGNDWLKGEAGNDTLDGGAGNDTLDGGAGNDTYIMDLADADSIADAAGSDTISTRLSSFSLAAHAPIENLAHLGDNDFTGTGNAGANTLSGGGGNDTLDGGLGADTLKGGAGDDVYLADTPADKIVEAEGGGTDTIRAGFTAALAARNNVENLELTGSAGVNAIGNELGNRLAGNEGANLLSGLAGDDTLLGNGGVDILQGGDGNDSLDGGAGNDRLDGGKGDDTLSGGAGNDSLAGGDLLGNVGSDTVVLGGNLADYLFARVSGDSVTLNRVVTVTHKTTGEKDTLTGIEKVVFADVAGGRLLNGLPKSDTQADDGLLLNTASPFNDIYVDDETKSADNDFDGGAGDDSISGGLLANTLAGGLGKDTLSGGAGNDVLSGGDGNDSLDGGLGDDSLAGGKGDDIYFVDAAGDSVAENAAEGIDTVRTTLASFSLADKGANVEHLVHTGAGNFSATGNALANSLTGGTGNDTLDGLAGADIMTGGAGDDSYTVDHLGDKVVELVDGGSDSLFTSLAAYSLAPPALAQVENLAYTGALAFTGTGNALNNRIDGGAGNDKLDGGKGDDTLSGGAGNDSLAGGDVLGNVGSDTVVLGGNLADYLFARVSGDSVTLNRVVTVTHKPTGEKDTLTGIEKVVFADVAGGRLLNGLPKSDTQADDGLLLNTASPFNDIYVDDETKSADNDFDGGAGDDSITGGLLANTLAGGLGKDTLSGGAGNDVLSGGDGNDSLDGGLGDDSLAGGKGDDIYFVDAAGDSVTENTAEGIDTLNTSLATLTLAAHIEKMNYSGSGNFTGAGNELANVIAGNTGNDTLAGGEGADTLLGGEGADTLDGGAGADRLEGGAGNDSYIVDNALDTIIDGGGEADTVHVGTIKAYTLGSALENLIYDGSDPFTGNGNAGSNQLTGGAGNNTLNGLAGDDTLTGGAGNDLLAGGDGSDRLIGGAGADTLSGGLGADYFVFNSLDAVDAVRDFSGSAGQGDKLLLDATLFNALTWVGGTALADGQLASGANLTTATDATTRLIYDSKTGNLYYDADGNGESSSAMLVATLGTTVHPAAITAADFGIL